jgi:hypothetical protein
MPGCDFVVVDLVGCVDPLSSSLGGEMMGDRYFVYRDERKNIQPMGIVQKASC